jgi:hypothetical protein
MGQVARTAASAVRVSSLSTLMGGSGWRIRAEGSCRHVSAPPDGRTAIETEEASACGGCSYWCGMA